ncbi:MAG: lipocalin family protein [Spirochaetia bacterium]|jgi:lipocalin
MAKTQRGATKMKASQPLLISSLAALTLFGCAGIPRGLAPLRLVESVDIQKYLGRWYEIARFTHRFERSLVGVTAEYSIRDDGRIQVINSGFRKSLDGKHTDAKGVAWIPDPRRPAALKVSFFWPFAADYLIFGLDQDNYSWALVGDNSREYLWFLARMPEISDELLQKMQQLARDQGYDPSRLDKVPQKPR